MKKFRINNIISLLVLFLITISIKSYGQYPERIAWTAPPQEFVFSLYRGVLDAVPPNQEKLDELAYRINSKPSSRLDLFWIFINSKEYQATMYAKQEKEYQVYYQYVTVGSTIKHSYYFAKFPSGADMSLSGSYTFFVAAALRDYYASYDENSLQYFQPTYENGIYSGNSEEYCQSKYCPECDDSIILLGVASDQACQDCLDKNKDRISECMNGSNNSNNNEVENAYSFADSDVESNSPVAAHPTASERQPTSIQSIQDWDGNWTITSKHTSGASATNKLKIDVTESSNVDIIFANVKANLLSITANTLVYSVRAGGNEVTTTLKKTGNKLEGTFSGYNLSSKKKISGTYNGGKQL